MLRELRWPNTHYQSKDFITNLSLPIFSLDRKLVIIAYQIYCGKECGEQSTDVFIKTKSNKWEVAKIPVAVIMY